MGGHSIVEVLLHLDKHLGEVIQSYQGWTYGLLALCVFVETGLVVMPFLPGDTLLLTAGLFAQTGQLNLTWLILLLACASILGDNTNFWIGRLVGKRLFRNPQSKVFNAQHLEKAKVFYSKHGFKAVVIGKWVAVIRTVVPFVAGMEAMPYAQFFPLSVISALIWVVTCTIVGYYLGGIPIFKENFEWVIVGVLAVTGLVILLEFIKHKREARLRPEDKLGQTEPL